MKKKPLHNFTGKLWKYAQVGLTLVISFNNTPVWQAALKASRVRASNTEEETRENARWKT